MDRNRVFVSANARRLLPACALAALAFFGSGLGPPAVRAQVASPNSGELPPLTSARSQGQPPLAIDTLVAPGPHLAQALQPQFPADGPPRGEPRGVQNAPGVPEYESEYDRQSDPVPDYVYDPDYYNAYDAEVHQLADYAPPGYETRDYQSAPGDPLYRLMSPPVRVSQAERERLVVGGIVPGSILAPGTNTSIRLRGFVRLAALYDLDPIGLRDAFVPNTIPVPQQTGENFNMSGRISRFAIESWTPTDWCERTVHTFIEGDFFNGPDQAAGGGGNPWRLRHAFFDVGHFRFGQQNTVFMDGTNWPSLVDFQGPNGWTNQRQPSARVTLPLAEQLFWATSMERPFSNITTNGLGVQVQDMPDFATHLRYETDFGHLQVAGLIRSIGYQPNGGDVERLTGSGIAASLVVHPWALVLGTNPVEDDYQSGLTRSRVLLQGNWGNGIGRYIQDFSGQGLDGQVDPVTGVFRTVPVVGWNASYELWLNENWLSNFTYSEVNADNNPNQLGTTYDYGSYSAVSLWWIPVTRMSFGVEYVRGDRRNLDGQSAFAQRLHALAQYNF